MAICHPLSAVIIAESERTLMFGTVVVVAAAASSDDTYFLAMDMGPVAA